MTKYRFIMYAVIASLLWGTLNTAVKLGYEAYGIVSTGDIFVFAGTRFCLCGLVMTIYALITNPKSLDVRNSIIPIMLSGFFAIILNYGFQYLGLKTTASSTTGLLKQSGSLLYICFSFIFFKDDKFTLKKLVGSIMGAVGIVVLSSDKGAIKLGLGEILIILASVCTVISNIISKKTFCKVPPITFTGLSQLFGGAVLVILGTIMGGTNHISLDSQIPVFLYICTASVVSYCFWYTATHNANLSNMLITKFIEPFFAAVTGAIFLSENVFQVKFILAFILIVGGIYISSKSSKKEGRLQK